MSDREVDLTQSPETGTGDYQRESARVAEDSEEKRPGQTRDPCKRSERDTTSKPECKEGRDG